MNMPRPKLYYAVDPGMKPGTIISVNIPGGIFPTHYVVVHSDDLIWMRMKTHLWDLIPLKPEAPEEVSDETHPDDRRR